MRTVLKTLAIATLLTVSLGGCASVLQFAADVTGTKIVPQSVQQGAYKAASVSFTAWENVQTGFLQYGHLPPCVEPKAVLLCRNQATWESLQAIDRRVSGLMESTRPVIQAGTGDVDVLMALPSAVYDAQQALQAAKKESAK